MVSRGSGMIAVMLHAGGAGDLGVAVIHHVGMRHTIRHRRAMAEGQHGWRRHEAECREDRKRDCRSRKWSPVLRAVSMGLVSDSPRCQP